jgi:hypothetical protein
MRLRSLVRKVDDGERTASGFLAGQRDSSTQGEGAGVATPSQVSVWVGLDVGKESHFADVPGLVMRRAADLYPGEAKTDRRDAYIIADTARTRRKQVHWLDASSDKLLAQLRVLSGFDTDMAEDQTRVTNRLRDAMTSIAPALERAIGNRLQHAGVRDLVAAFPTLTALRAAGPGKVRATIARRSPRIAGKTAEAVAKALAAQDVTMPAEQATGRVIAELGRELDRVFQRRDALAGEIEEAFLAHPFGEVLAPVTRQSGTSLNAETRSRRGNHRLKNAMFLRRCDVILAMLRNREPYQPDRARAARAG